MPYGSKNTLIKSSKSEYAFLLLHFIFVWIGERPARGFFLSLFLGMGSSCICLNIVLVMDLPTFFQGHSLCLLHSFPLPQIKLFYKVVLVEYNWGKEYFCFWRKSNKSINKSLINWKSDKLLVKKLCDSKSQLLNSYETTWSKVKYAFSTNKQELFL